MSANYTGTVVQLILNDGREPLKKLKTYSVLGSRIGLGTFQATMCRVLQGPGEESWRHLWLQESYEPWTRRDIHVIRHVHEENLKKKYLVAKNFL
jgi:hypothetical protein